MTRRQHRSGYTLLEVSLAIGIGLLLLAALYVALDVQLRYMSSGRRAVAEAQLARGLLNRVAADLRNSLAMLPTTPTAESAAASATGATTANASGSGSGDSSSGTDSNAASGQFGFGLLGDSQQMTLFLTGPPRLHQAVMETQLGYCDQRRVLYALVPGQGLVRQEVRNVAGDDGSDPTVTADVLAQEVVELQFRYFNGSTGAWEEQWDGSVAGPPLAVEITLGLLPPDEFDRAAAAPVTYRLVVSIPTGAVPNAAKGGAP